MKLWQYRQREQGATALIIVMFFTLMMTVLAVGFVQMMVREQKASQDSELSQGAYDGALAGAEDGKRVLSACISGDAQACAAIDAHECNTVAAAKFVSDPGPDGSVIKSVATGSNGSEYSQAYTCVKVLRNTKDLEGDLAEGGSTVKRLLAVDGKSYDRVTVQWFTKKNSPDGTVTPGSVLDNFAFKPLASWPNNRPPVFRLQLIQHKDGALNIADLDTTSGGATLYLYPMNSVGGSSTTEFEFDTRTSGGQKNTTAASPQTAQCATSFAGTYACQATVLLPNPNGGNKTNRAAFLRITSLYNEAHFSLSLKDGNDVVEFKGVQPSIDSTGRAADVYRRVVERVEMSDPLADAMLYPRATVDTTDSFCKAMVLTDDPADFDNSACR